MLLYLTLFACAVVFGVQVYRYDLKNREPIGALILATLMGGAAMWLAGLAQVAIMRKLGPIATDNWTLWMSLAAATTEETAKFCAVVMVIGLRPRWFNDPLDGLVYGAFAGLGAALHESIALMATHTSNFLPAAEPVRLAGHLTMGGIAAFGLSYMKLGRRNWRSRVLVGIATAMVLHATWDIVAFDAADRGSMTTGHTVASMVIMLGGMLIFRGMLALAAGETRGLGGRRGFRLELDGGGVDRRAAERPANA